MPDSKLLPKLIERLLQLSAKNKIDWEPTANENEFQAVVKQYLVTVGRNHNRDGWDAWDYSIHVADGNGTQLDEAVANAAHSTAEVPSVSYGALENLFDQARRRALNVEEALNDLLSSLDSLAR